LGAIKKPTHHLARRERRKPRRLESYSTVEVSGPKGMEWKSLTAKAIRWGKKSKTRMTENPALPPS